MEKKAIITWNADWNSWVVRLYVDGLAGEVTYPVKDVNPETELGFVSEEIVLELYDLYNLGYKIMFI